MLAERACRTHRQAALVALLLVMLLRVAGAAEYRLPAEGEDLVGALQQVRVEGEDTLLDIALREEVGQREIVIANPGVDRWLPGEGTEILLPVRYILPDAPRSGIVLNVPEMRLYFYPPHRGDGGSVVTYPVSIGRMDWQTPLGTTRVVQKTRHPDWRPPQSIKDAALAEGKPLADVIPAGPANPLGTRAMRLGIPGYLIHGTNRPFGVGMQVTHGCVRLTPAAVEALFERVKVGTKVNIVDQPIKVGWSEGTLFVEVHPPLEVAADEGERIAALAARQQRALALVDAAIADRPVAMDEEVLAAAVVADQGIPVPIAFALPDEPADEDAGRAAGEAASEEASEPDRSGDRSGAGVPAAKPASVEHELF